VRCGDFGGGVKRGGKIVGKRRKSEQHKGNAAAAGN